MARDFAAERAALGLQRLLARLEARDFAARVGGVGLGLARGLLVRSR